MLCAVERLWTKSISPRSSWTANGRHRKHSRGESRRIPISTCTNNPQTTFLESPHERPNLCCDGSLCIRHGVECAASERGRRRPRGPRQEGQRVDRNKDSGVHE